MATLFFSCFSCNLEAEHIITYEPSHCNIVYVDKVCSIMYLSETMLESPAPLLSFLPFSPW